MRTRTILLVLAVLGAVVGCSRRPIGHFGEGAFYHARGHYRVRYAEEPAAMLSDRWRLASHRVDDEGRPQGERMELVGYRNLDVSWLMGRGRSRSFGVPRVDLLYREDGGTAEIWARTVVLPQAWDHASAASVLHAWVAAAERGQAAVDPLERVGGPTEIVLEHFGAARIDGLPAHWVELRVTRDDIEQRVTVVGVRPAGHRYQWRGRYTFPMMLAFGFTSSPEDHAEVRAEFQQLVARVDIRR